MKHLFTITLFAAGMLAAANSHAQTKSDPNVGHKVTKTAKVVGNKTAEIASKGASAVVDKRYEGKMARGGQTIYINKHSRYYYVDKKGHHVYVNKSDLRDKPSH